MSNTQPESILEANLVKQLIGLKYEPVAIADETAKQFKKGLLQRIALYTSQITI